MRIYAYGIQPPVEGAQLIHEQFRLANTYQRVLVFIECHRRTAVDNLYRHACPTEWVRYETAQKAVEEAVNAVRVLRTRSGDMLEPDQEMKAEAAEISKAAKSALDVAREAEKVARQAWKDARKKATPKLKRRLQMCDAGARVRNKFAYNAAGSVGLAWGTRLKVGESAERAAKAAAKIGVMPHMPKFDGGGALSVQLQGDSGINDMKGLTPLDALSGKDTRFRLELVDAGTWQMMRGRNAFVSRPKKDGTVIALPQPDPNSRRSQKRKIGGGYAVVRLRIGSNGRDPVWGVWPAILHRPLPSEGVIKWATIHAKKIGPRTEWRLLVTVDDEFVPIETPKTRSVKSTLAVNFGWRTLLNNGLRVAYAVGSDGHQEEIRVHPAYVNGVAHVDSLRSIRDKLFESAKKLISDWRLEDERPEWFMRATRYIDQWRSQKHLVWLFRDWKNQRFNGDSRMWDLIAAWHKKDKHLWFWESDEREKLWKMRQDFYRVTSARWASKYERIIVTDMDLRDFAKREAPEMKDSEGKVQRISQRLAAPSELRGALKNACSTRGATFEEREGVFMTQTCHVCAVVFAFAARTDLEHTCECGARWDQDFNHCRNLLASGKVVSNPGKPLASSVAGRKDEFDVKKGRWQKRRSQNDMQQVEIKK